MNSVAEAIAIGLLPHVVAKRFLRWRELRLAGSPYALRTALRSTCYADYKTAHLDLLPQGTLRTLRTVVDVGANVGDWSQALLVCAPVGQLVALEPNPAVFKTLAARLRVFPNARCLNVAAGACKTTLPLHSTAGSQCSSLLTPKSEMVSVYGNAMEVTEKVEVPVEQLDDLLEEFAEVSLLKIDVQGYEREVLKGATATLNKTNWLLVEANFVAHYEQDILFPELNSRLAAQGFALAALSAPFLKHGRVLWADALFRRAS